MIDIVVFAATAFLTLIWKKRYAYKDAEEMICLVDDRNTEVPGGCRRQEMRSQNLWHRATYVLIKHKPTNMNEEETHILVQKRSKIKDYCPGRLDPLPGGVVGVGESYMENAEREILEEMGFSPQILKQVFIFPYEDDKVKVWGGFFECTYTGALRDLKLQESEVDECHRMSISELQERIQKSPDEFMPDACHAIRLYFQRQLDASVNRKLLHGYSSGNLDEYKLRKPIQVIFFDCDDCLYFNNWATAKLLTAKINDWCKKEHGFVDGQAYELYKEYGTAVKGLLAEGYLPEERIDEYLQDVHNVPITFGKDMRLREMILSIRSDIPRYVFTASVREHAERCLKALGIDDLFVDIIDCKSCGLETKHSQHSFKAAMKVAGVSEPESCLFFDDSMKNLAAARRMGWRGILVGQVARDTGDRVSSEHAEHEIPIIHDVPDVLPELFTMETPTYMIPTTNMK